MICLKHIILCATQFAHAVIVLPHLLESLVIIVSFRDNGLPYLQYIAMYTEV
jgi:hypothetical protein